MQGCKVNILGTEYTIQEKKISDDDLLEQKDGYCDSTTKSIVVCSLKAETGSSVDVSVEEKRIRRHEIIHGFMYESGLDANSRWGTDEELVDWIALQSPKIFKVFQELDIL